MKNTLLILIVLGISLSVSSQELMTIGEVFDFEIYDEFEIYPNPTKSKVLIRDNKISENFELFLINSSGKQIYSNTLFGEINEINIQDLDLGIYFLKIIRDGKLQTFKLIKK